MGLAKARRGDGRGEPNGLPPYDDLDLMKAGGTLPKPGGGAGLARLRAGDTGVDERGICHGAGELRRIIV